jgi:hypothetical protein
MVALAFPPPDLSILSEVLKVRKQKIGTSMQGKTVLMDFSGTEVRTLCADRHC